MMSVPPTLVSGVLVIVSLTGCGGAGLVPVEGTIMLDGEPLVGATIAIQQISDNDDVDKRVFSAETDANGHYVIKPFEGRSTGAPPGRYRVMITTVKATPDADEMTEFPEEPVPMSYRDGSQVLVVPEQGSANADFTIQTR